MIRLIALFSLLGLLPISACIPQAFKATPHALNRRLDPGERYQGIRLLGALRLADAEIGVRDCAVCPGWLGTTRRVCCTRFPTEARSSTCPRFSMSEAI